jgi:hypothetical protein
MRKAFLLVLCTVAALTLRSYAQTHTPGGAIVSSTGLSKGATVLDVSTFPGATMDAKLQACINAAAPAGTCDARGITGTQVAASTLKVNKSVTILWGAVNYQTGSLFPGIYVSADNVAFVGLGRGITTIGTSVLYRYALQLGSSSTYPGPNNFSMSGISMVGPNPNYSGTVNTSGTSVTWVSGSTDFTNLVAGEYIRIGPLLTPYKISTVNSNTSLTLSTSAGTQSGVPYRVDMYSGDVSISGTTVTWLSGDNFTRLASGGNINFGSPGSYTDWDSGHHLLKIQSVNSDTSLTLVAAPSCGDQSSIPYFISWDVHGTVSLACFACQNMHLSNNEFTGWNHTAIGIGSGANHGIISGNSIHDNPGEGITIYNVGAYAGLPSYHLVTNNQMSYNGLSCFDTNGRFDTFSNSECSYNGWANKTGDTANIQIHGSNNTVDGVTADFGNQANINVDGSNHTINNVHACGTTNLYYGVAGDGNGHGITIGNGATQVAHDTVTNSIFCNNAGSGIILWYVDQAVIEGNQAYGNGNTGINVSSSADTNTSLANNVVTGNSGSQILDRGLHTVQISNRVGPSSRMRP